MAYATPSQFILRYDVNQVGQLVRDNGTKATSSQLLTDTVLMAMLDDATAEIKSAMYAGARYSEDDLNTLATAEDPLLIRLTCDLAYGFLVLRRGYTAEEVAKLAPGYARAQQVLQWIRDGERVFDNDNAIDAGRPERAVISTRVYLITSAVRYFGDLTLDPVYGPRQS